ncbi:transcriptional regulator, XRE family with cupin sensor [Tistlia consotensis]|uniref:Transcriptional regulator, XRE family with cupin sensor n=1 Tax=Tistlia consotensis USBA 355 TaxID=560819 RepID=A0A1Y6BW58_9PROT|nr:XRE family transcriptional regulator [Tistlia consotensis]SMF24341.1 transcriptional regulator, XRE family with cupin sensor [Tistlia consotensis USBA 355]SNR60665.1 transcriptional regulator, XRE family with cupin sensor [Tistlia consotensis]
MAIGAPAAGRQAAGQAAGQAGAGADEAAGGSALGTDLRALRRARRVPLAELGLAIGRSVGFLSQVERGLSQPSIEDLRRIAAFFQVPLSLFFGRAASDPQEQGVIVRAGSRRQIGNREAGLVEELLSPDLSAPFEMVRSVFLPGAALAEPSLRDTQETGFLVSGRFEIEIAGTRYALGPGDSFHIDHKPFRWRNPGDEPAVVVWVIAPPTY